MRPYDKNILFTSNYQKHTTNNPFQKFLLTRYFSSFKKLIPDRINNILDIGCGEGFLVGHLPKNIKYTGIDHNPESIKIAKATAYQPRETDFFVGDVYKLSFPDNQFDVVACLEVLEHLEKPEKALAEIRRVAKKYVVLSVPNEPWFQLANFLRGKYLSRLGNHPEHINRWNVSQFKKLISKYFIIKKTAYSFPWQIILCEI